MAQTLKLNKQQLTDLILETYQEVLYFGGDNPHQYLNKLRGGTKSKLKEDNLKKIAKQVKKALIEQPDVIDGEIFLDPNQSIDANIASLTAREKEQKAIDEYVKSNYTSEYRLAKDNEDSFWDYHLVLDIIAVILYIAGALTVQFYGLGLVLELLAIFVELGNAWSYVAIDEDPDYFMAGLTASFTIFPAGNLIMKTVFKPFTKSMSKMFKAFMAGTKVNIQNMIRYLGRGTVSMLSSAIRKSGALKYVKKLPGWIDEAMSGIKSFRSWANDSWFCVLCWLDGPLTWIVDKFLKVLKRAVSLFVQVITEMSLYDPLVTKDILIFLGEKIGLGEVSTTFGEWLEKESPFRNKILLKAWNNLLEETGSIEGAIETTVWDCGGRTYEMDELVNQFLAEKAQDTYLWDIEGFKKFVPNQPLYQSKEDGSPRWEIRRASRKWDGFSWGQLTREIEKWWKKGWRPNVYAGIDLDNPSQAADELLFGQWVRYSNNEEIKSILNDRGITSCKKFVEWIKNLEKDEVGLITTLECMYNPKGFGCDDEDDDGNMFGD